MGNDQHGKFPAALKPQINAFHNSQLNKQTGLPCPQKYIC